LIIKKALEGLEGVETATVSYEEKRGEVSYNPEKVGKTDIINKVKEVGFMAKVLEEERGQ
jgi:copper chaperone CopZ